MASSSAGRIVTLPGGFRPSPSAAASWIPDRARRSHRSRPWSLSRQPSRPDRSTVPDDHHRIASLSPSRASDFMTCPLLYRFRVIDRLPERPSRAATRGTLVHAVLETLFDLPADERTLPGPAALLPRPGSGCSTRTSRCSSCSRMTGRRRQPPAEPVDGVWNRPTRRLRWRRRTPIAADTWHGRPTCRRLGGRTRPDQCAGRRLPGRGGGPARSLLHARGPVPARAGRARAAGQHAAAVRAAVARHRRPHRRGARWAGAGRRLQDRPGAERGVRGQGAVPDEVLRTGAVAAARHDPGDAAARVPRRRGHADALPAGGTRPAGHRAQARRAVAGDRAVLRAAGVPAQPQPALLLVRPPAPCAPRSTGRHRRSPIRSRCRRWSRWPNWPPARTERRADRRHSLGRSSRSGRQSRKSGPSQGRQPQLAARNARAGSRPAPDEAAHAGRDRRTDESITSVPSITCTASDVPALAYIRALRATPST